MIRRPPRSTRVRSSAASDVYKRQAETAFAGPRFGTGHNKVGGPKAAHFSILPNTYLRRLATSSLSALPAWNFGTNLALMYSLSPVAGFKPLRPARFVDSKLPNPVTCTRSPFLIAAVISPNTDSTAAWAAF